ncbi:MAG: pyridoxamine 5'-phosphate oxidase family protein [Lachnospiraceae bacterium]|nr:pyridoxamine 5'-phosphate oxidase family protein [Lachnospiraceae bacterium]
MENFNNGITRRERAVTDREEIVRILDKCQVIHIGMLDGEEVYVIPMNYGYVLEEDQLTFYVHGAKKGRKMDVVMANPKVSFEMECDVNPFSGKTACQYGTSYSCIMGKGIASIVENPEEKLGALSVMMKTQTGKEFTFTEKMASIVNVIKIEVTGYSVKKRPVPGTQES